MRSETDNPTDVHLHGRAPWSSVKVQNNGYQLNHRYAMLRGVTIRTFTSDNPKDGEPNQDLGLRLSQGFAENLVVSNCLGNHRVTGVRVSGGELRRMSVARALIKAPGVLLADEPTGDLDDENTHAVLRLLRQSADEGAAVLLVTHEREAAAYADRVYRMNDGVLTEEHSPRGGYPDGEGGV